MDNDLQPRRMHPLAAAAAGSIVVVSLLGVAAITGVLPVAKSTDGPTPTSNNSQYALTSAAQPSSPSLQSPQAQPQASQQAPLQAPQQALQQAPQQPPQQAQYAPPQAPAQRAPAPQRSYAQTSEAPAKQRAATCSTCGTVQSIEPIRTQGSASGLGAVGGAVAGGLLGNQFGAGNGRTAMTVVGALGGGLAGNEVEKRVRSETVYRVYVRMDTGTTRYWTYQSAPGVQPGDRVRLENNGLVRAG
ncbi:glycine zipper 2TM domain-containing protein [Pandoraea sp. SD6-2]|uniref:glycine zipper 2TM domain-containing protein n=1 Tax=Pandoraea sp. SD6-2 TaxID=1286093 RepID=UPI0003306AA3|nr:glycine zipper 2TM domain-containing protein [Pandoraea sp. SD6-2]EON12219.1 17 kDa surface antigen [Pandoraea sp. SD6-2]